MSRKRIVDLSRPLGTDTPVFPGDGPVRVAILDDSAINLSRIDFSLHTGTHMDAPFHFFPDGETIDQVIPERAMGSACMVDLRGVSPDDIQSRHLELHRAALRETRIVVLHTGWSRRWTGPEYFTGHPCLASGAAQLLVDCGVQLVAVDMPSVDRAPYPAHRILLGAGVLIVENLANLESIGVDRFELIVLPLKLVGRDGSPVRAIAIV